MSIYYISIGVYLFAVAGLALYGFNTLLMTLLFARYRRCQAPLWPPFSTDGCPHVTVQLPIYNERLVVERLIDSVVRLEYPRERLSIQVLDDSTDETAALARARAAYYRARGVDITYQHRAVRKGYKAGALAAALPQATGEFIAIFDADFRPDEDFLKRTMPQFINPRVGMVQVRWGHLNAKCSLLTRAQAIALDGHFVVEQTVRSRAKLLFNFNGSAGVWRRACIEDASGWQADTVAEDLDLSYRAQLRGWEFRYLPEVVARAQVPLHVLAFKRQQFRWVKGSVQCLLKHGLAVATSRHSLWWRVQGLLHLGGYLAHPLMLVLLLSSLPVVLGGGLGNLPLGVLSVAGMGPPLMCAVSQLTAYPDGLRRTLYFPLLMLLGTGVSLNNTWAVTEAIAGRNPTSFLRTPKTTSVGQQESSRPAQDYSLTADWTSWGELVVGLYALLTALLAFTRMPGITPFLLVFALGFFYTAGLGLVQSWRVLHAGRVWRIAEAGD